MGFSHSKHWCHPIRSKSSEGPVVGARRLWPSSGASWSALHGLHGTCCSLGMRSCFEVCECGKICKNSGEFLISGHLTGDVMNCTGYTGIYTYLHDKCVCVCVWKWIIWPQSMVVFYHEENDLEAPYVQIRIRLGSGWYRILIMLRLLLLKTWLPSKIWWCQSQSSPMIQWPIHGIPHLQTRP